MPQDPFTDEETATILADQWSPKAPLVAVSKEVQNWTEWTYRQRIADGITWH